MKFALIGSYGHPGVFLDGVKEAGATLSAAVRFGPDDPLDFVGNHAATPANTPVYDDHRRMLEEIKPDVVGVFTPLYRIAQTCIDAVDHRCHVLSEKPLATELPDLERLHQAVKVAGVEVWACLTMRCLPPFLAVRNAVRAGRIGQPVLATAQKSYPFDQRDVYYEKRQTYGGTIPWQAIHAIDFVTYCAGKHFIRVAAMNSNAAHPSHPGMEDNGGLLLEMAGGGHAVISFDYCRPWSRGRRWGDDRLRIVGSEAAVEILEEGTQVVLTTPTSVERVDLPPQRSLLGEMLQTIRAGGKGKLADPLLTTEESFLVTEISLKARDAADAGEFVEL